MRVLWFALMLVLLNGCVTTRYATIGDDQAACDQTNKDFPGMVDCLNQKVTSKAMRRQPDADLYLAYITRARDLAQKVREGKISESAARKTLAKDKTELDQHLIDRQNKRYAVQNQKASEPSSQNNAAILSCIQAANSIPRSGIGGASAAIASCYDNPYQAEDRFQREKENAQRQNQKMVCKPNYSGTALECQQQPF